MLLNFQNEILVKLSIFKISKRKTSKWKYNSFAINVNHCDKLGNAGNLISIINGQWCAKKHFAEFSYLESKISFRYKLFNNFNQKDYLKPDSASTL